MSLLCYLLIYLKISIMHCITRQREYRVQDFLHKRVEVDLFGCSMAQMTSKILGTILEFSFRSLSAFATKFVY